MQEERRNLGPKNPQTTNNASPYPAPQGTAGEQREDGQHLRQRPPFLRQDDPRPYGHDPRLPRLGGPRGLGLPLDAQLRQKVVARGRRLRERGRLRGAVEPHSAGGHEHGGPLLCIVDGLGDGPRRVEPRAADLGLEARRPPRRDGLPGKVDDAAQGAVDGPGPVSLGVKGELGDAGELGGRGGRVLFRPGGVVFQGGGVEPERKRGGKERERERRRKRKKLTRVSTRTLTPQATRRRTSLAPTVPVAPVIATSPLIPAAASELAAATAAWELAAATLLLAAEARGEGGAASVVIVNFDRRSTPRRPAGLTAFDLGTALAALESCTLPRSDALVVVESISLHDAFL